VQTAKEVKTGREKLARIIEMCMAIEAHAVDPFLLDVDDIIKVVREYFPNWEKPEDLNLDAETIHHLASVVKLQSEWVKHRTSSLYADPFLMEDKINQTPKEDMVGVFLKAWHPVVEMEQISLHSLREALGYWETLVPLTERWKQFGITEVETGTATRDELIRQRILSDKVFSEELEQFWVELKEAVEQKGREGKILYWDYIGAETYEKTVERAFLTSFLITYGYATLQIRPLEEETFIIPFKKPVVKIAEQQSISIPIPVSYESWQKWRKGELE
jgi:hypothetical protein